MVRNGHASKVKRGPKGPFWLLVGVQYRINEERDDGEAYADADDEGEGRVKGRDHLIRVGSRGGGEVCSPVNHVMSVSD